MNRIFLVLLLVLSTGFALSAQTIGVNIKSDKSTVVLGTEASGTVTLSIPKVLHINSNRPRDEYLIPTSVSFRSNQVKIGKISYPRGANRKFGFSPKPLNVYEGTVRIRFRYKVPQNLRSQVITISAVVAYQACTDEVCYPPQKKNLILRIPVKKR